MKRSLSKVQKLEHKTEPVVAMFPLRSSGGGRELPRGVRDAVLAFGELADLATLNGVSRGLHASVQEFWTRLRVLDLTRLRKGWELPPMLRHCSALQTIVVGDCDLLQAASLVPLVEASRASFRGLQRRASCGPRPMLTDRLFAALVQCPKLERFEFDSGSEVLHTSSLAPWYALGATAPNLCHVHLCGVSAAPLSILSGKPLQTLRCQGTVAVLVKLLGEPTSVHLQEVELELVPAAVYRDLEAELSAVGRALETLPELARLTVRQRGAVSVLRPEPMVWRLPALTCFYWDSPCAVPLLEGRAQSEPLVALGIEASFGWVPALLAEPLRTLTLCGRFWLLLDLMPSSVPAPCLATLTELTLEGGIVGSTLDVIAPLTGLRRLRLLTYSVLTPTDAFRLLQRLPDLEEAEVREDDRLARPGMPSFALREFVPSWGLPTQGTWQLPRCRRLVLDGLPRRQLRHVRFPALEHLELRRDPIALGRLLAAAPALTSLVLRRVYPRIGWQDALMLDKAPLAKRSALRHLALHTAPLWLLAELVGPCGARLERLELHHCVNDGKTKIDLAALPPLLPRLRALAWASGSAAQRRVIVEQWAAAPALRQLHLAPRLHLKRVVDALAVRHPHLAIVLSNTL